MVQSVLTNVEKVTYSLLSYWSVIDTAFLCFLYLVLGLRNLGQAPSIALIQLPHPPNYFGCILLPHFTPQSITVVKEINDSRDQDFRPYVVHFGSSGHISPPIPLS
jgi:hypothetical protein